MRAINRRTITQLSINHRAIKGRTFNQLELLTGEMLTEDCCMNTKTAEKIIGFHRPVEI